MELSIGNHIISAFNNVTVNLSFDSVADTFEMQVNFDPYNPTHRKIFKPGMLYPCTLKHGGVLIMVGTLMISKFSTSAVPTLTTIAGYSKTGVLEDCPVVTEPLESNNLTFKQICERVTAHYGIAVAVDNEVSEACNKVLPRSVPKPDQSVKSYLDDIAKQLNVVLSHTTGGNLYLTRVKSDKLLTTKRTLVRRDVTPLDGSIEGAPDSIAVKTTTEMVKRNVLYNFRDGDAKAIEMSLSFDAQKMHSDVMVLAQSGEDSPNGPESIAINPYIYTAPADPAPIAITKPVSFTEEIDGAPISPVQIPPKSNRGPRPRTAIQTKGDDNTAPLTARAIVGDELKSMVLTIKVVGWTLSGHLITPNQMITVTNPGIYCYNESKWFIQAVTLTIDETYPVAVLTCVVPECYNNDDVKNIFNR
jgi:prophage tail gpP-like protein